MTTAVPLTRLVYARLDELSQALRLDPQLQWLCHGIPAAQPQAALLWAALDGVTLTGRQVLDLGCGRGGALAALARRGGAATLTGIDVCPEQIAACRRQFATLKVRWQVADACHLPQPAASCDLLLAVELCEGLHAPANLLHGAARVLRQGGLLVLADLLSDDAWQLLLEQAAAEGLVCTRNLDLSNPVAQQLARSATQAAPGDSAEDDFIRQAFVEGRTRTAQALEHGQLRYRAVHLQRDTRPTRAHPGPAWHWPLPTLPVAEAADVTIDPIAQVFPQGAPERSRLSVFAFPFGGGGASLFAGWRQALSPAMDFCPLQLPGREGFRQHSPLPDMAAWVQWALAQLRPHLAGRQAPYVLYGHCLGGQLAYELALALQAEATPPAALWLSASAPPDMAVSARLARLLQVAELRGTDLPALLALLGGTAPQVLASPALLAAVKHTLLADFQLACRYQRHDLPALHCPVHGIAGLRDKLVPASHMHGWQRCAKAGFSLAQIDGEHFFLRDQRPLLQAQLRQLAERTLAECP
ncbi:methyltransferase domain-containing protein [Pantoea sp. Ap-967]|uniref:thioesterase domain-containing protein n=1 Tax=Pantoea sp. Ap-967 TaxID=2608362 RepID=UPI0014210613|nr:thioesterase domain-containing protein [Pantoea sp. Ap-967]NIE78421.1 methyltransferase domain-containing protein [Pantoea sp. Ap-967]